jgi:hypothetical protein
VALCGSRRRCTPSAGLYSNCRVVVKFVASGLVGLM